MKHAATGTARTGVPADTINGTEAAARTTEATGVRLDAGRDRLGQATHSSYLRQGPT